MGEGYRSRWKGIKHIDPRDDAVHIVDFGWGPSMDVQRLDTCPAAKIVGRLRPKHETFDLLSTLSARVVQILPCVRLGFAFCLLVSISIRP